MQFIEVNKLSKNVGLKVFKSVQAVNSAVRSCSINFFRLVPFSSSVISKKNHSQQSPTLNYSYNAPALCSYTHAWVSRAQLNARKEREIFIFKVQNGENENIKISNQ